MMKYISDFWQALFVFFQELYEVIKSLFAKKEEE